MAESRLRAPVLGAQLEASSCLEKCRKSSADAGRQPFSGKSFYLDLPAGKSLQFLTGAIPQLGGRSASCMNTQFQNLFITPKKKPIPLAVTPRFSSVHPTWVIEGFLSKEVSYIVSSRREVKAESSGTGHRGCPSPSEVRVQTPSTAHPKGGHPGPPQKPADSGPLSRGKELLQKAIRNQGSSSGGGGGSSSSLLTSARSWGVRILHVDEMMMHVQQLSLDASRVKKQGPEKPEGTCPAESRTRKVARLKAPFLKIEDESKKFRPFHHQFKSFPEISFLGPKDASPFEAPMTLRSSHHTREPKDQEPSPQSATRTLPRRRKGFCECCQEAFEELHAHLRSAQHQGFALEAHPYAEVDRVIAQLSHSFANTPFRGGSPRQPGSPCSDRDPLCPETPPPGQHCHPRAASPRMREEEEHQAPGTAEHAGTVGGAKAPNEPVGVGEMLGPVASCQELGGPVDVIEDPPETPMSRSPAHQCLLTSSGSVELSDPDVALVGHKRKIRLSTGNPEKRSGVSWPQALLFVPRATSPCSARTASGGHPVSLPPLDSEHRPPAPLLPWCHSQTCLPLPTDGPAECRATQPPWPGEDSPPGSEHSECAAPGPGGPASQLPCGSRPAVSPPALSS